MIKLSSFSGFLPSKSIKIPIFRFLLHTEQQPGAKQVLKMTEILLQIFNSLELEDEVLGTFIFYWNLQKN